MDEHGPAPLRLCGVSKRWRGQVRPVLQDVELELPDGGLTWLGGDNGAGKTTLLRLACGLLEADEGEVRVRGYGLRRDPSESKRRIGVLMAGNSGLWARLTVRQQLQLWARLAFVPKDQREPAVDGAVRAFGLGRLVDRRLDRISMGERQRLRLAMTFLHRPEVVLLDEPRNSLDVHGLELLRAAVSRVREQGGSALWCAPTGEEADSETTAELRVRDGQVERV